MNHAIWKALHVIVLITGKLSSQLGGTSHLRNSKIIHTEYSDKNIFLRLYIIIIQAFGLSICGLSPVGTRNCRAGLGGPKANTWFEFKKRCRFWICLILCKYKLAKTSDQTSDQNPVLLCSFSQLCDKHFLIYIIPDNYIHPTLWFWSDNNSIVSV